VPIGTLDNSKHDQSAALSITNTTHSPVHRNEKNPDFGSLSSSLNPNTPVKKIVKGDVNMGSKENKGDLAIQETNADVTSCLIKNLSHGETVCPVHAAQA